MQATVWPGWGLTQPPPPLNPRVAVTIDTTTRGGPKSDTTSDYAVTEAHCTELNYHLPTLFVRAYPISLLAGLTWSQRTDLLSHYPTPIVAVAAD